MYTTMKEKKEHSFPLFIFFMFVELKNIWKAFSNGLDQLSERDKQQNQVEKKAKLRNCQKCTLKKTYILTAVNKAFVYW